MNLTRWAFSAVILSTSLAWADVKLPAILSDNMVLQAGKPLAIWGTAEAAEKVTVTLGQETLTTSADAAGKWQVKFKPLPAGATPKMTVVGNNTLTVSNILVGSVWICSGQSNMEFGMKNAHNAATEIPLAKYPQLRLFMVTKRTALQPQNDVVGKWVECTPKSILEGGWAGFSAVAYFFGRDFLVAGKQPVGLIQTCWGGTPAQSWTSFAALENVPQLKYHVNTPILKEPEKSADIVAGQYQKVLAAWETQQEKWQKENKAPYDEKLKAWTQAAKLAKEQGQPEPAKPQPPKAGPKKPLSADKSPWTPTALYNGMIAPLLPYAIEGAIWYQGESNAGQAVEYRTLFPTMITDWRQKWGQGDFPFLFVQLANYHPRDEKPTDPGWAWLREAQTMTLQLPNTGMAVAIDIGQSNDIHPRNKSDVGHRLALHALKMVYGKNVATSGPLYDAIKMEGTKIRVSFKELGGGLMIGAAPSTQPSVPPEKPAAALTGFAVAGEDQVWVWAQAKIEGDQVVVWSDQVAKPVAVRYAWANNPACNLYNQAGLPASPFRSDDWKTAKAAAKP